jgi:hypothetical protein
MPADSIQIVATITAIHLAETRRTVLCDAVQALRDAVERENLTSALACEIFALAIRNQQGGDVSDQS